MFDYTILRAHRAVVTLGDRQRTKWYDIPMETKRHELIAFSVVFLAALILLGFVLAPYVSALVLAFVFFILFEPLYRKILGILGHRRSIAALLTLLLVFVVILTPLTLLGIRVFNEAQGLYTQLSHGGFEVISGTIADFLQDQFDVQNNSPLDIRGYTSEIVSWIVQNFGSAFGRVTRVMVTLFIALFALYYLLKDSAALRELFFKYSPLSRSHSEMILERVYAAATATIRGSVVVAIIQGICAGIGFYIFGVPNPAIWGMVASIGALVPFVGTMVVVLPSVLFLFISGSTGSAFGLLLWGMLVVGTIDNFLKPKLIGRGSDIHPFFVLLSVLGGISFFGAIGFILGPLFLSFFFALLRIYPEITGHTTEGT